MAGRLTRNPITHSLRINSIHFTSTRDGRKCFTVCFDDQDYRIEDTLNLLEYKNGDGGNPQLTGENIKRKIIYILRKSKGLLDGFIVLGFDNPSPTVDK